MGEIEEGDMPTTADGVAAQTLSLGKWVWNLGSVAHDFRDILGKFKNYMEAPRGPDPDYRGFSSEDAAELLNMVSVLAKRRPVSFNNGDGEDSGGVKKWLASVGAGLAVLVIVAAWSQSSQLATATVKIDYLTLRANDTQIAIHEVQDHQKAQDELIARIREQLDVARARSSNP